MVIGLSVSHHPGDQGLPTVLCLFAQLKTFALFSIFPPSFLNGLSLCLSLV